MGYRYEGAEEEGSVKADFPEDAAADSSLSDPQVHGQAFGERCISGHAALLLSISQGLFKLSGR